MITFKLTMKLCEVCYKNNHCTIIKAVSLVGSKLKIFSLLKKKLKSQLVTLNADQ